jgi:hypothetical protein
MSSVYFLFGSMILGFAALWIFDRFGNDRDD